MAGQYYGEPLSVAVADGRLVISVGIHVLAHAVAFSDWANPFHEASDNYIRQFAIADPEQFAKDVAHALQAESEDGSTPLSNLLDAAAEAAVNDGSEGTADGEFSIPHGQFAPCETWATEPGGTT